MTAGRGVMGLFGGYVVRVTEGERLRAIALWMSLSIAAKEGERGVFWLPVFRLGRVKAAAAREGIGLEVLGKYGLLSFLSALFRRPGMLVGAALAFVLLLLSCSLVWRVDIVGNERLGTREIRAALSALGVSEGVPLSRFDGDAIEHALQLSLPEVAWVSVYRQGTTVCVKIREKQEATLPDPHTTPAHLVAVADAVIREIHGVRGRVLVERGQVVRAGEVLISGIVPGVNADRLLSADGEVIGEVATEFTVRIPYLQQQNVPISEKTGKIQIKFFGKTLNIFQNTGNSTSNYGTIIEETVIRPKPQRPLPILVRKERWIEYRQLPVRLTESEAYAYALATAQRRIAETVGEGELLVKTITEQTDEMGCTLRCRIVYTASIAVRQELYAP